MNAKEVLERCSQLEALRTPFEYIWQEIGYLSNARYLNQSKGKKTQGFVPHTEIYDTTLRTKSRMQANGITSMLFPRNRDWLRILPPWKMRNDKVGQKMYREAGEAVIHYLRASNFHHINHKIITDRSQLGTGTMRMEWVDDDYGSPQMNFRKHDPLSYFIDHNSRGMVDTFGCYYEWSAFTAAQEWGIENLSPKLQKEAKDQTKRNSTHTFVLLVQRRAEWEKGSGNKGMPFMFRVVEKEGQHDVMDSGIEVFPFIASRYETHDSCSPWGSCPAWEILPSAYKANFAAKFMMVMGERAAVPPVLAPASMKDEGVMLGAAEITYVSDNNPQNWPRELTGGGNYQVGMEVWKQMRDSVDEAYHGALFNMFSRLDREVTATQITAMQGEHNAQLDPTITALNQDHTDPVVTWAFTSLYEAGIIELPSWGVSEKSGKPDLPVFAYDNALTMNYRRAKALEVMGIIDQFANLQQIGIDVDIVKLEETARRVWRDSGQDEDELYSEQEYQDNEDAKAQARQQAQAMEAAEKASVVGRNAASAGLPVAQMMGGAA